MSSSKKIAFVVPSLQTGGAENVLTILSNELVRSGYEIHIIFLVEKGELLSKLDSRVHRWNLGNGSVYFSAFAISKIVRQINPDVIFPWMGYLNSYLIFSKKLFPGNIRWLCRESTIPSKMNSSYRFSFLYAIFYKFYNRYDQIVCQSNYMADDLVQNFKVSPARLVVINNPIDTDSIPGKQSAFKVIGAAPGDHSLLYVGGLNKWKRVDILLKLMLLLPFNYHLTIVGEGIEYENLQQFVEANHLQARVRFIKGCQNPYPYYQQADSLLLCSAFEGFPNVALEAMASGCPVIGFDIVGGANEILENYGGFIVDGNSLENFAGTVIKVCEEMSINKNKIAEVCREKYGLEKIMHEYRQLFE